MDKIHSEQRLSLFREYLSLVFDFPYKYYSDVVKRFVLKIKSSSNNENLVFYNSLY